MTALNVAIENVSRRGFLGGILATGGLIVAARVTAGPRRARLRHRRRQNGRRRRHRPACFRLDRPQRPCDDHRSPRRNGYGLAHQPADGRRRRARCRLVARACQAIAGRRKEIRQSEHRRLAQPAAFHPADAPMRRRGAADARNGGGASAGASLSPRCRRRTTRSSTSLRAVSSAMAISPAAASALPTPPADQIKLKDAGRIPLSRQRQRRDRRSVRHHHGPRHLRHRRQIARHEIRRHRAAAGAGRQAGLL